MLLTLALEWTVLSLNRTAVPLKFQILNMYIFIVHGYLHMLPHFLRVSAKRLKVKVSEASKVSLQKRVRDGGACTKLRIDGTLVQLSMV